MAWKCPVCGREFANDNQWHSCGKFELADHFIGRPPEFVALYHGIEQVLTSCGECRIEPAKTAILAKRRITFVAVKLRKTYVGLGIRLLRELSSERVNSVLQMNPEVFENRFKLQSLSDLDDEMEGWLREAWDAAE
ncbi:MAG: hypothetical protein BMS9Abin05_1208 [Rhodothermia bacterium]|nr:MAG: hypothetical protein BMS9Abin05_1208 [Rhodothermia bacterium]